MSATTLKIKVRSVFLWSARYFCPISKKKNYFLLKFLLKSVVSNFAQISHVGPSLMYAESRTDRWKERWTDMNQIDAFRFIATHAWRLILSGGRLRSKCDGTRAETRFRLSAKRTSPFKSAGTSVQSTTGSRGVRISGSNAGYTKFWDSVKGTGYLFHSPVSPSLPPPVRQPVPSRSNRTLNLRKELKWLSFGVCFQFIQTRLLFMCWTASKKSIQKFCLDGECWRVIQGRVSKDMQPLDFNLQCFFYSRVQLKRDGTRWRRGGKVIGKLANGVGSQYPSHYLGTWCIQHYYRWCAHLGCQ